MAVNVSLANSRRAVSFIVHAAISCVVCVALLIASSEGARGEESTIPDIVLRKSTAASIQAQPKQRATNAASKTKTKKTTEGVPSIMLRPGKISKQDAAAPATGATGSASVSSGATAGSCSSASPSQTLVVETPTVVPALSTEVATSSRQSQVHAADQANSITQELPTIEPDTASPIDAGTYMRFRAHSLSQVNFQTTEPIETLPPPANAPAAEPAQGPAPNDPCVALANRPFHEFGINTAIPAGELPVDDATACWVSVNQAAGALTGQRCWGSSVYAWDATCLCHRPLYFEETNLERYGYGCCETLQPAASAAHFFGTIPLLPYCMAVDCPSECVYTLGQYRPGSCVPKRYMWPPCSPRAILAEGGVWTAMIFLIP